MLRANPAVPRIIILLKTTEKQRKRTNPSTSFALQKAQKQAVAEGSGHADQGMAFVLLLCRQPQLAIFFRDGGNRSQEQEERQREEPTSPYPSSVLACWVQPRIYGAGQPTLSFPFPLLPPGGSAANCSRHPRAKTIF